MDDQDKDVCEEKEVPEGAKTQTFPATVAAVPEESE